LRRLIFTRSAMYIDETSGFFWLARTDLARATRYERAEVTSITINTPLSFLLFLGVGIRIETKDKGAVEASTQSVGSLSQLRDRYGWPVAEPANFWDRTPLRQIRLVVGFFGVSTVFTWLLRSLLF